MNKHREKLIDIIRFIAVVLLVWLFHQIFESFEVVRRKIEMPQFDIYRTLMRLDMVAIGVAIEGKRLYRGLKEKLNVNLFGLMVSLFFVLLSMVPLEIGYKIGLNSFGYSLYNPLQTISWIVTRGISWNVVSLLGGIGIVRSITNGPTMKL